MGALRGGWPRGQTCGAASSRPRSGNSRDETARSGGLACGKRPFKAGVLGPLSWTEGPGGGKNVAVVLVTVEEGGEGSPFWPRG